MRVLYRARAILIAITSPHLVISSIAMRLAARPVLGTICIPRKSATLRAEMRAGEIISPHHRDDGRYRSRIKNEIASPRG